MKYNELDNMNKFSQMDYDPNKDDNLKGFGKYDSDSEIKKINEAQDKITSYDYTQEILPQESGDSSAQFQSNMEMMNNISNGIKNNSTIPNESKALNESSSVKDIMGAISDIEDNGEMISTSGPGDNNPMYGYNKALLTISECINILQSSDYWLPVNWDATKKAKVAQSLDKASLPLVNGLEKLLVGIKNIK